MKKIFFSILMLCTLSAFGSNPQANQDSILARAVRFSGDATLQRINPDLKMRHIALFRNSEGALVIASDRNNLPILGYAERCDEASLPPALSAWLSEMDQQIEMGIVEDIQEMNEAKSLPTSVEKLLTSEWSQQGYGYNSQVPPNGYGNPTVGCAALAMGQVMRYWGYPVNGRGETTYTHEGEYDCWTFGTLHCDYSEANLDYANMPDRLTYASSDAERLAVGRLLKYCGYSLKMLYDVDCMGSSGAEGSSSTFALKQVFGYNSDAYVAWRTDYTSVEWKQLLKTEIAEGRPVLFGGYSPDENGEPAAGHAFVLDGYEERNFFHVNWGWGGAYDGYYDIATLMPIAGMGFSMTQTATIGLDTNRGNSPILQLENNLTFTNDTIDSSGHLGGSYSLTNSGYGTFDGYVALAVYDTLNPDDSYHKFYGYTQSRHITLVPGASITTAIDATLDLPVGRYYFCMHYGAESFANDSTVEHSTRMFDACYDFEQRVIVKEPYVVGIHEIENGSILAYPNPTSGQIHINATGRYTILSADGRIIEEGVSDGTIDLSQFAKGFYFLVMDDGRQGKIIVR